MIRLLDLVVASNKCTFRLRVHPGRPVKVQFVHKCIGAQIPVCLAPLKENTYGVSIYMFWYG